MMDEAKLKEKLRLIEVLFAGAKTAGEKDAADRAKQRILGQLYLESDAEDRALIRARVGNHRAVLGYLHKHIARLTGRLAATRDINWLRVGLALASINDGRDTIDYELVLNALYRAALRTGIDPGPYFKLAARLSNVESDTPDRLESFCGSSRASDLPL